MDRGKLQVLIENHTILDIEKQRYPVFSLQPVPYDRNVPNNLYIRFVYTTVNVIKTM